MPRHSARPEQPRRSIRNIELFGLATALLLTAGDLIITGEVTVIWMAAYALLFALFAISRLASLYAHLRGATNGQMVALGLLSAFIVTATEASTGLPWITTPAHAAVLLAECLTVGAAWLGNWDLSWRA